MQIHVSVSCCAASVVCVCWYNETCAQTFSSLEVHGLNNHCKEKIPEVFTIVLSNLLIKKIYLYLLFKWLLLVPWVVA